MAEKISEYEFVVRAIKKLKKPPYKGCSFRLQWFQSGFPGILQ